MYCYAQVCMSKRKSVDVHNLNHVLDMLSAIMKRIDKCRGTIKNFKTMLDQVKVIIHNNSCTLHTLEDDVSSWFLHVGQSDQMRISCIQRLKTQQSEREIQQSAIELSKIMNATSNVQKSYRRWARLIKLENYTEDALKDNVLTWVKRWKDRWMQLEHTYKSLRAELLASSGQYQKIYNERHAREAILDSAENALSSAQQIIGSTNVLDTPEPMERGQPAHYGSSMGEPVAMPQKQRQCTGNCGNPNCTSPNHVGKQPPQKRSRQSRPRPSGITKSAAGSRRRVSNAKPTFSSQPQMQQPMQQQQQQMQLPNGVTPEMLQQFMMQQQGAAPPPPPQKQIPEDPVKIKLDQFPGLMNPSTSISYAAGGDDEWT